MCSEKIAWIPAIISEKNPSIRGIETKKNIYYLPPCPCIISTSEYKINPDVASSNPSIKEKIPPVNTI